MKAFITILCAMLAGALLCGCGTIMRSHVGHMNDQELQLRRYQLAITTNRGDSDSDDIREKEAVEVRCCAAE